jgi:hypothetical protein
MGSAGKSVAPVDFLSDDGHRARSMACALVGHRPEHKVAMASLSTRSHDQKLGSVAGRKQCRNRRSEMRDYVKGNVRTPLRRSSSYGLDDGAAGCFVAGRSRVHESGHRCDHAREDRFHRPRTQFSLPKCPTKGQFGASGSVDADDDPRHGDDRPGLGARPPPDWSHGGSPSDVPSRGEVP